MSDTSRFDVAVSRWPSSIKRSENGTLTKKTVTMLDGGPTGGSIRRKASKPHNQKAHDLSGAFSEHTWDVLRIEANYPHSHIDVKAPAFSKGLSTRLAAELLVKHGKNMLPEPKEISNLELFLRQFWNLLWVLLIGAATLSLLQFFLDTSDMVNLWITLIMYGMIVVMCTVSWYQEMEARRVVRGFQKLLPDKCHVVRDGHETLIYAHDLVVGDIIHIRSGARVAADARILTCSQLKLEASSITGEAEPIDYQWEEVPETVPIFESHNVAFNGSLCVDGEGMGVVIRTGTQTVIGQIADLTTGQGGKKSRLEKQVQKYVKFLVGMALSVGTATFIIGGFVHKWHDVVALLSNAFLVCIIGMVPCGLPATVTSLLTMNARRMASKNVYLKRLDICEALGQVNIIASDKTGTLTKNVMTVTDLWHLDNIVSGLPKSTKQLKNQRDLAAENGTPADYEPPISDLLTLMVVCNAMRPISEVFSASKSAMSSLKKLSMSILSAVTTLERGQRQSFAVGQQQIGSPSEVAMIKYAEQVVNVEELREEYNIVFEIPFNSRRKWHLMIAKLAGGKDSDSDREKEGNYLLMMKGAPEILAERCSQIMDGQGREVEFDTAARGKFQHSYDTFADNGRRVIGFAQTRFTAQAGVVFKAEEENFPTCGLTFLGTCAIMDPPREESASAIKQCYEAGIKVFMVTGDHHATASAIARQIGLIGGDSVDFAVVQGDKITLLSDGEWDSLLKKRSLVFSRTTPEQKLLIVEQCQRRGQLIAMTGDGVNDAPALKKADIGIAMGSGSEVAKQASDIILMDDNFSSIVGAVEEGRVMYDNIKKLLGYTMPHSFPEVWPIIVHFCFGWPIGITALQILSIDLGSEILPGISLSKEPIEGDVMQRPPRSRSKVLVSNTLLAYAYAYIGQIQSFGCLLAYLYVFWSYDINVKDLWMSSLKCWQRNGDVFTSNGHSFSVEQQLYINRQACSAWQMGIIFGQFFNIWSARTRRMSLFKHGFFSNPFQLFALTIELCLVAAYVYLPGLNNFLGGAPIPWQCWALVAAVGLGLCVFNELRKLAIRRCKGNRFVRWFKW